MKNDDNQIPLPFSSPPSPPLIPYDQWRGPAGFGATVSLRGFLGPPWAPAAQFGEKWGCFGPPGNGCAVSPWVWGPWHAGQGVLQRSVLGRGTPELASCTSRPAPSTSLPARGCGTGPVGRGGHRRLPASFMPRPRGPVPPQGPARSAVPGVPLAPSAPRAAPRALPPGPAPRRAPPPLPALHGRARRAPPPARARGGRALFVRP